MAIAMTILSISTLIGMIYIMKLHSELAKAKAEKRDAEDKVASMASMSKKPAVEIEPGDSGIIPGYGLTTTGDNPISFTVCYEVEILEVAADKLKVSAKGYTSHDSYAKDPANKQSIIGFMQSQWVDRREVSLVMDDKKKRSIKLESLGI